MLEVLKKAAPLLKAEKFEEYEEDPAIKPECFTYLDKFNKSVLDQTKEYPLPVPVLNLFQNNNTVPLLTLKSFSLWQGKQKSKKTTALALAVAELISPFDDNIDSVRFCSGLEGGVVIIIDNEQGESYAARTMKLILKLAGVPSSPKLIYCDLRGFAPGERKKIIEAGLESTPNVKMLVIDGLVDLLNDFMDASEGHLAVTDILKWCSLYDIHVAGVLHQNKNDKNARAHVGTISSQKCEIEITTEVDPNDKAQSLVTCVNSRGVPFEPFAIRWDKGSLPAIVQEWTETKGTQSNANKSYDRIKAVADRVFTPLASLTYTEAIKGLMQALGMSEDTAKRRLKDLQNWDIVEHGSDGRYRKIYKEGARVQKGANEGA